MVPAPLRVVVDANVRFPFVLRDTILRAAVEGFFQLYWSRDILDETERNLVSNAIMTSERAKQLRTQMERIFPEAMVTDYESLKSHVQNHEKDRHVSGLRPVTSVHSVRPGSPAICSE